MNSMSDERLRQFFREVYEAVDAGNRGLAEQPYRSGTFMVTALSGDIELTVSDVSEEDAILIAADLKDQGIRAQVSATTRCPSCGARVPRQANCVRCRAKLSAAAPGRRGDQEPE
jgi:hypothetical protein